MPSKRIPDDRLAEIINETGRMVASTPYSTSSAVVFDLAMELQEYRAATVYYVDPEKVAPEPNKPSDVEVIAERLAKVEQRQDEFEQRTVKALNAHDERFDVQSELRQKQVHNAHQRIDKVVEIIGERVSGLVDRLDKLEKPWEHQPVEVDPFPYPPGFPTGGADTAEAAAEAVLPVPQRGDRVRLEGARTTAHYSVPDGWHEVVGQSGDAFQVRLPQIGGDWLPYIPNETTGLKEVKANGTR